MIIRGDGRAIGWRIPNRPEATPSNVDQYLISLRELEALTSETFPVDDWRKNEVLVDAPPVRPRFYGRPGAVAMMWCAGW